MAKLQETSETVTALQFLVMNLERQLRLLFVLLSTFHDKLSQPEMNILLRRVFNATMHGRVNKGGKT